MQNDIGIIKGYKGDAKRDKDKEKVIWVFFQI